MVFGHNSNLKLGNITFHVQTEDRGEVHALLDTTVYYRGRVLHRRTNNYFDLLPLNADSEQALKLRLEEQHRMVMDEIRSGALDLPIPPDPVPPPTVQPTATPTSSPTQVTPPGNLSLELVNAKTWLTGKRANLHLRVNQSNGTPVSSTSVKVEFEGAESEHIFSALTDDQGESHIAFDLPRITGADAALVIRAENNGAHGQLRFALRVKPRVPSV